MRAARKLLTLMSGGFIPGGGDQSADNIRTFMETMGARWQANDGVTFGGALTLDGQAVGNYEFRVVDGDVDFTDWTEADWISATEDSVHTIIVARGAIDVPAGVLLQPTKRKLGLHMLAYAGAAGNLNIDGEVSMSQRGANHSAATGSNIPAAAIKLAPSGTYGGVTDPQIPATGGAGGAERKTNGANAGSAGTAGGSGGGGTGARVGGGSTTAGAAAAGTSFSGGSGSGAAEGSGQKSPAAPVDGGPGGAGASTGEVQRASGGGAGNPGGAADPGGGGWDVVENGNPGTGGALNLYCTGTFSGSGSVTSAGANGGGVNTPTTGTTGAGGGGSGGGPILIMCGADTSSITPSAPGGAGGVVTGGAAPYPGAAGGAGSARKLPYASA